MKTLFLVFLGGGFGSVFRYGVSTFTQKLWLLGGFPLGTLFVNGLGCFAIGYFSIFLKDYPLLWWFFIVGFCGGFTTFSTFSMEVLQLCQTGQYFLAILYVVLSLLLGFVAVFLGGRYY